MSPHKAKDLNVLGGVLGFWSVCSSAEYRKLVSEHDWRGCGLATNRQLPNHNEIHALRFSPLAASCTGLNRTPILERR